MVCVAVAVVAFGLVGRTGLLVRRRIERCGRDWRGTFAEAAVEASAAAFATSAAVVHASAQRYARSYDSLAFLLGRGRVGSCRRKGVVVEDGSSLGHFALARIDARLVVGVVA